MSGESMGHGKKRLGRLMSFFPDKPELLAVSHEDLRSWMMKLGKEAGFEAWTLRHHLKNAKTFFGRAVVEGWIVQNPALKVTSCIT